MSWKPREMPDNEFVAIQEIIKKVMPTLRVLDLNNFIRRIESDPLMSRDIIMIRWIKMAKAVRKLQYDIERLSVNKKDKSNGKRQL